MSIAELVRLAALSAGAQSAEAEVADPVTRLPEFAGVPLTEAEKRVFGADAERCEITGFIFETGNGALPKKSQTANFKAALSERERARAP